MTFLQQIFDHFRDQPARAKIIEIHLTTPRGTDGTGMLDLIARARGGLCAAGVVPGDRVASLAPNSARWIAADLATIAEGAITVPMFERAGSEEIGKILASAQPKVVIVATDALRKTIEVAWPDRGDATILTHDALFAAAEKRAPLCERAPEDPVAIIYTSGTSGEPKGVVLSRRNIEFMIPKTIARLETVAVAREVPDRVFHFLPLCFAASRLMLWTQLSRPNPVMLSTDLTKMQAEFLTATPNYFLTVPMVLERIRSGVLDQLGKAAPVVQKIYARAVAADRALTQGEASWLDRGVLALARRLVFAKIKQKIGPKLDFVISGSAPLAEETQRWFRMLGIPVYQAYGLTETTGIVSLDLPARWVPGRVGYPIDGVETKLTDDGELWIRGPNVFEGYWNNPTATQDALVGEWFRTGDQVDIRDGNLQIIGRLKNLIVPESGHNVAPEPLEEQFALLCPTAQQCVIVGHGRPFLTLIATGSVTQEQVDAAVSTFNEGQPYYKKVKGTILTPEPLSADRGLLTANLKLRRAQIEAHFKSEIDGVYAGYFAEKKQREGKGALPG